MKHRAVDVAVKTVRQAKLAKNLIWIIPMMATAVTVVGFVGMCYAAVIQWMRTLTLERRALKLYIEEREQSRRATRRTEG